MEMGMLRKYANRLIIALLLLGVFAVGVTANAAGSKNVEDESNGRVRFTNGPIILDFASDIWFGQHQIINEDMTLYAISSATEYAEQFVRVIDTRGTVEGWTLQVKQNGQLTSTEANVYTELIDAELSIVGTFATRELSSDLIVDYMNPQESPQTFEVTLDASGQASSVVAVAGRGRGAGAWLMQHGTLEEGGDGYTNNNIRLFVPGTTPREAVEYTTTLTWYLVHAPGNTP